MSSYFRDSPRFSDRTRGKSGDELLQEAKERFYEDNDAFFEPNRPSRDSFDRPFPHFPRVSTMFAVVPSLFIVVVSFALSPCKSACSEFMITFRYL